MHVYMFNNAKRKHLCLVNIVEKTWLDFNLKVASQTSHMNAHFAFNVIILALSKHISPFII